MDLCFINIFSNIYKLELYNMYICGGKKYLRLLAFIYLLKGKKCGKKNIQTFFFFLYSREISFNNVKSFDFSSRRFYLNEKYNFYIFSSVGLRTPPSEYTEHTQPIYDLCVVSYIRITLFFILLKYILISV